MERMLPKSEFDPQSNSRPAAAGTTSTFRACLPVDERYPAIMTREQFLKAFFAQKALVAMVELNPEQAMWLFGTSPGNRSFVKANMDRICRDMEDGLFGPSNDALIFDILERMRNGHHRTAAQHQTQTTQVYLVRRNVPESECVAIDQGAKRNGDAQVGFVPGFHEEYGETGHNECSIVTAVANRGWQDEQVLLSAQGKANLILHLSDGLKFILKITENKKIRGFGHSCALAVFVRAYHAGADQSKLKYALEYLCDGGHAVAKGTVAQVPGVGSLHQLSAYYNHTKRAGRDLYLVTEQMLKSFLEGKERDRPSPAKKELFPLDLPLRPVSQRELFQRALGYDGYAALVVWSKGAADQECKPGELATAVCGVMPKLPGDEPVTQKAIALRVAKTMKLYSEIVLPFGRLVPVLGGTRISLYRFTRNQAADTNTATPVVASAAATVKQGELAAN